MCFRPISKAVSQQYHVILRSLPYLRNCVKTTKARPSAMEAAGSDSDGREFKSAQEMWREQTGDGDDAKKIQWYREGIAYREGVEASVDGVLGGFGLVNDADIKGSEAFLSTLLLERFADAGRNQHLVALDCGSGIGRIPKNLLVDLLEPVSHFLDAAHESLSQECFVVSDMHKATNFYCVPLQEFTASAGRYNVIWIQWCIGPLTDDDFISFFKRAKVGLKPGGFVILKENIARNGFFWIKKTEASQDLIYTSRTYVVNVDYTCIKSRQDQKGLPEELFAVKMYALTTEVLKKVHKTLSKVQASRPGIIK